jgi:DNA-binding NarL/FixJ family response regulator
MRILLTGMSNMLNSIITAALQQSPDIIIAGMIGGGDALADRVRAAQADGVIIQVDEPADFERFRGLLMSFPSLKVVGIKGDGRTAFVHELYPRSTQLVELSAATLLAALQAGPVNPTH